MTDSDNKFNWDDSVSLKEYFDARLKALEMHIDLRIDALKEATTLAKASVDDRLVGMNEFRESLKDQSLSFARKSECSLAMERVDSDIRSLRESRSESKGGTDQTKLVILMLISFLGLAISLINLLR